MTYFEILTLNQDYKIDLADLESRYLAASKNYHPDFLNPADSNLENLKLSALVNQAYNTLKNPFLRAEYLLKLEGGQNPDAERTVPAEILEEVMDIRFEMESQGHSPEKNLKIKNILTSRVKYFEERLLILFEQLKCSIPEQRGKVLHELRLCLNSSKYFLNIIAEVDD